MSSSIVSETKKQLTDLPITSRSTVQPNVLLRTGVFVPEGKTCKVTYQEIELSNSLSRIEFASSEGYTDISMQGPRLNMSTDFKVWCGIVWACNKYGYSSENITLKFSEFAKLCGFPNKKIDADLRKRIHTSLGKIRSQSLSFSTGPEVTKSCQTGLVLKAVFDTKEDTISILADPSLWELYVIDHQVLLSLNVMDKLPRNQTAQSIYVYFQSLENDDEQVSFSRLRTRLQLTSNSLAEQNRTITNSLKSLIKIGYLQGYIFNGEDGDRYFQIEKKCPKLTANDE